MPIDSILVSAAVVSAFVVFAGVLIWADLQSMPKRQAVKSRETRRGF